MQTLACAVAVYMSKNVAMVIGLQILFIAYLQI
jgi:hypothetical protein